MLKSMRPILWVATLTLVMMGTAYGQEEETPRVVATYLHGTLRCQTCLQIESLARYDVTQVLASDIESGQLIWRSLDYDQEENAHFEEQFALDGPALVITLEEGDEVVKWVRMDRVWEIYDDVEALDQYIMSTVEEYLQEASKIVPDGHFTE